MMGMTALYRCYDENSQLLYIGITSSPPMRLYAHEGRSDWFRDVATVSIEWHKTREDALLNERLAIRKEAPTFNKYVPKAYADGPRSAASRLLEWVYANDHTIGEVAEMIGVGERRMGRILGSTQSVTIANAVAIERLTGIPASAWVRG